MELILERIAKRKTYTIGRLYIQRRVDDEYLAGTENQYFCDTLEPTWRDYANGAYKVKGRSAIPEGRYAVVISFSPKFKQWLPILLGVPKFEGNRRSSRPRVGVNPSGLPSSDGTARAMTSLLEHCRVVTELDAVK